MIGMRHSHCNLVVLIRNRTIRAYFVGVIFNALSWLSGVLCYRGYKPPHAQQAPLWEGLRRPGCSQAERENEEPGSCAESNFLAKSTFFLKLQTAALRKCDKDIMAVIMFFKNNIKYK